MLYYIILYRARGPGGGSSPQNWKISSMGVVHAERGVAGGGSPLENDKITIL